MNQAIFSYVGGKVWQFKEVFLVQNKDTFVILTQEQGRNSIYFDDMYEAIGYLAKVVGSSVAFELGEEKSI